MVSTLLTVVGQPNIPTSAGNGGFSLGFPALPSIDSISDYSNDINRVSVHNIYLCIYLCKLQLTLVNIFVMNTVTLLTQILF